MKTKYIFVTGGVVSSDFKGDHQCIPKACLLKAEA